MNTASPCACWRTPPLPHSGHCCFVAGAVNDYQPGKPIPCGHNLHMTMTGRTR